MKSIIQEGSSIWRAIEEAWKQAGMPKEFSIKIYEDSQKTFFIFTKKPAKIGLFFEQARQRRPHGRRPRGGYQKQRDKKDQSEKTSTAGTEGVQTKDAPSKPQREQRRDQRPVRRSSTPKDTNT